MKKEEGQMMDKKLGDMTLALIVMVVGFFFSYMYKWNKIIEDGNKKTGVERKLFLLTHAMVSALIGVICFYGLDQFYPELNLMFKMGLSGLGAVLSDFIIPTIGGVITSSSEMIKKAGEKWSN